MQLDAQVKRTYENVLPIARTELYVQRGCMRVLPERPPERAKHTSEQLHDEFGAVMGELGMGLGMAHESCPCATAARTSLLNSGPLSAVSHMKHPTALASWLASTIEESM